MLHIKMLQTKCCILKCCTKNYAIQNIAGVWLRLRENNTHVAYRNVTHASVKREMLHIEMLHAFGQGFAKVNTCVAREMMQIEMLHEKCFILRCCTQNVAHQNVARVWLRLREVYTNVAHRNVAHASAAREMLYIGMLHAFEKGLANVNTNVARQMLHAFDQFLANVDVLFPGTRRSRWLRTRSRCEKGRKSEDRKRRSKSGLWNHLPRVARYFDAELNWSLSQWRQFFWNSSRNITILDIMLI